MRNQQECELAWAAGLYEGEGGTYIRRKCVQISVQMTDKESVDRFRRAVGIRGQKSTPYQRKRKTGDGRQPYKVAYRWRIGSQHDIELFMKKMSPRMLSRRLQEFADIQRCYDDKQ